MSWYTKYRPVQIKDLDLIRVRDFFLRQMQQGSLSQAYLFAGPKGTGKTSTSRILGAMLNDPINEVVVDAVYFHKPSKNKLVFQEPDPNASLNQKVFAGHSFAVQELDAASNRGIDDIRAIKERIALAPSHGKMAVYILDEVHMLTKEAFNALLKVLEEPPAHVVFILATTELHKVPATIVSRCSLVEFYKATDQEMLSSFERVLKAEKTKYQPADLMPIAKLADGSFRDGVKMLEIASQSGKLDLQAITQLTGGNLEQLVEQLLHLVLAKNQTQLGQFFEQLRSKNTPEKEFYKTLLSHLHQQLLIGLQVKTGQPQLALPVCQFLLKQLLSLDLTTESIIPFLSLEIALLEMIAKAKKTGDEQAGGQNGSGKGGGEQSGGGQSGGEAKIGSGKKNNDSKEKISSKKSTSAQTPPIVVSQAHAVASNQANEHLSQLITEQWEKLLDLVASKNSTLAALLRSGKPSEQSNGKALINVYYKFHQEQLQQPKFLSIIEDCGQQLAGQRVPFEFILTTLPKEADLVEQPATDKLADLVEEALM